MAEDGTQEQDEAADLDAPNRSARRGGEAAGGIAPGGRDPTTPAEADAANGEARQRMRDAGFGDHKGAAI